jgi:two-component system chemotaxis response regulator CheB
VLEEIMASTPTPVLVLSGIVHNDKSASAIEALVAGAVIAMPKPARWTAAIEHEVRRNVRMVHSVPVVRRPKGRLGSVQPTSPVTGAMPSAEGGTIVAIAASTGGPSALAVVLAGLVGLSAPVLIVQHLNADFVSGLVDWMTRVSPLPVILAVEGRTLRNGCVHIAPGGTHLRVAAGSRIELTSQPSTIHQPSANELFASVAERAGERGIGVLLTGMGEDGATGLAEMHRRGAQTIAQDEESCVVYGMPRAAVRLGAVGQLLPLHAIADAIMHAARARRVPG